MVFKQKFSERTDPEKNLSKNKKKVFSEKKYFIANTIFPHF